MGRKCIYRYLSFHRGRGMEAGGWHREGEGRGGVPQSLALVLYGGGRTVKGSEDQDRGTILPSHPSNDRTGVPPHPITG